MAFLGLRRSQWWLVAGWAFHPAWDMALHYFGPGHAFAPAPYALACMTWDPTVAAYIAFRILRPAKVMSAAVADKVDQRSWPVSDPRPWPIHARSLPDPEETLALPDSGRSESPERPFGIPRSSGRVAKCYRHQRLKVDTGTHVTQSRGRWIACMRYRRCGQRSGIGRCVARRNSEAK